jgi:glycosyltransferase involved in cell wall biosynthesis
VTHEFEGRLRPEASAFADGAHLGGSSAAGPTRVLHVYAGNLYGGVESFLHTMASQKASAPSARMDFALCFEGRLADELRAVGATVHMLGAVRVRSPWSMRAARSALGRVIVQGGYQVVVCHSAWPHAVFAPVVRRHGVKLAYYMHNPPNKLGWLDRWAGQSGPDLVVCNSLFTQEAGQWLFPKAPRRMIHCPVLPGSRATSVTREGTRASFETPESAIVIVHASRMQEWKGHRLLISALAELRSEPRWVCWLAGAAQRSSEVAYERDLRDEVARLGLLDRVKFIGQRDDMPAIFEAADIHCQPNTSPEPFGVVFVEALAAGLPVVTTAMGGPLEIVDSSCGTLVPPGDAGALAVALKELVRNDEKRAAMAAAGPARAQTLCDAPARTRDLAAEFSSLVTGPKRASSW